MAKVPGTFTEPKDPFDGAEPWENEELNAEELDNLIRRITTAWQANGLEPHGLQLDMVPTISGIAVLIDYLIDKGIVNKDKIDVLYKRELLRQYTTYFRIVVEHQKAARQKLQGLVAVPDKRIIDGHGNVIGGEG